MSAPSPQKPHGARRWVTAAKIVVAAALIGFLLWLVPMYDHLVLRAQDPAADRTLTGSIDDWSDTRATFQANGGPQILLKLDGDLVLEARFADGETFVQPPTEDKDRLSKLEAGLITTMKNASPSHMLLALALLFVGSIIAVYRWHILLQAVDLAIPFSRTFSLTFIGTFFNNVMPGLTGGDLVKAFYIARDHPKQKTEAIITVLVDRVLGLTGLALVAACVIPLDLEKYGSVAPWIYGLILAEVVVGCVFFSRRLRRVLGIDALIARLPVRDLFKKVDRAVFMYRYRRRMLIISTLLSMAVHLVIITAIGVIGVGLGLKLPFQAYYAIIPIGLIASALPITPSGVGVGEATFVFFLGTVGVSKPRALSLAFAYRIAQLVVSLIGGVCLARLKDRVTAEEMERFAESDDDNGPDAPGSGSGRPPREPRPLPDKGDTATTAHSSI